VDFLEKQEEYCSRTLMKIVLGTIFNGPTKLIKSWITTAVVKRNRGY